MFLLFCILVQFSVILSDTSASGGNPAEQRSCYDAYIKPNNGAIGGFVKKDLAFVTETKIVDALKDHEDKLDSVQKHLLQGINIKDVYAQTFASPEDTIYYVEVTPKNLLGAASQCVKFGGEVFKIDIAPYITLVDTPKTTESITDILVTFPHTTQAQTTEAVIGNPEAQKSCYDAYINENNGQIGGYAKKDLTYLTESEIIALLKEHEDKLDQSQKILLTGLNIKDIYAKTLAPGFKDYWVEVKPKNVMGGKTQCIKFDGKVFDIKTPPYVNQPQTTLIDTPKTTETVIGNPAAQKSCYDAYINSNNGQIGGYAKKDLTYLTESEIVALLKEHEDKLDESQKILLNGLNIKDIYAKTLAPEFKDYWVEVKPKNVMGGKSQCIKFDGKVFDIKTPAYVNQPQTTVVAETEIYTSKKIVTVMPEQKLSCYLSIIVPRNLQGDWTKIDGDKKAVELVLAANKDKLDEVQENLTNGFYLLSTYVNKKETPNKYFVEVKQLDLKGGSSVCIAFNEDNYFNIDYPKYPSQISTTVPIPPNTTTKKVIGSPEVQKSCYDAYIKSTNGQIGGYAKKDLTYLTESEIIAILKEHEDKLDESQKILLNGLNIKDIYAKTLAPEFKDYWVEVKPKNLMGGKTQCIKFDGKVFDIKTPPYENQPTVAPIYKGTTSTAKLQTIKPVNKLSCYDSIIVPRNYQDDWTKIDKDHEAVKLAIEINEDKLDETQKHLLEGFDCIETYVNKKVTPYKYFVEVKHNNLPGASNVCVAFNDDNYFNIDYPVFPNQLTTTKPIPEDETTPVKSTITTAKICPPNQEWHSCNTICPAYCGSRDILPCAKVCQSGCRCILGFRLRNKDSKECIKDEECPKIDTTQVQSTKVETIPAPQMTCYDAFIKSNNGPIGGFVKKDTNFVTEEEIIVALKEHENELTLTQKKLLSGVYINDVYSKTLPPQYKDYYVEVKPRNLIGAKSQCIRFGGDVFEVNTPPYITLVDTPKTTESITDILVTFPHTTQVLTTEVVIGSPEAQKSCYDAYINSNNSPIGGYAKKDLTYLTESEIIALLKEHEDKLDESQKILLNGLNIKDIYAKTLAPEFKDYWVEVKPKNLMGGKSQCIKFDGKVFNIKTPPYINQPQTTHIDTPKTTETVIGNPAAQQSCYDAFISKATGQFGGYVKKDSTYVTEAEIVALLTENVEKLDETQRILINGLYIKDVYVKTLAPEFQDYWVEVKPKNVMGGKTQCIKFDGKLFEIKTPPYVNQPQTTQVTPTKPLTTQTTQGKPKSCAETYLNLGSMGAFKSGPVTKTQIESALEKNKDKLNPSQSRYLYTDEFTVQETYIQTYGPNTQPKYFVELKPNAPWGNYACVWFDANDYFRIEEGSFFHTPTQVTSTKPQNTHNCKRNEKWNQCGSACPRICGSKLNACPQLCTPRCQCINGFIRHETLGCIRQTYCDTFNRIRELSSNLEKQMQSGSDNNFGKVINSIVGSMFNRQ